MKKQLYFAIVLLCTAFVLPASQLPLEAQLKINKYKKMAEETYKENEKSSKGIPQNGLIVHNRQEWENREKYWQKNGSKISDKSGTHKKLGLQIEQQKLTLDTATKSVEYYYSWSPAVVWQYCVSHKKYQQMKNQAEINQEDAQVKLLALQTKREYKHEKNALKNFLGLVQPTITLSPSTPNPEQETLVKTLKDEILCFKEPRQFKAFTQSSLFLKQEIKKQQSKE